MYDQKSSLVIGFHGCEAAVRDELLSHPEIIKFSKKPFDWLGHGIYFWENNIERAWQWAMDKKARGAIEEPAVIGAVLQLGHCCDFLERKYINLLTNCYAFMSDLYQSSGIPMPMNKDVPGDPFKDKLLRYLDCAVIEYMHSRIGKQVPISGLTDLTSFDSVRGAFFEGGAAFTGSGIFAKTHIQICIRNPDCIKGFFKPRQAVNFQTG